MGALVLLREHLAELLEDLAPGRVFDHEPDVLNDRSIYLGRPTINDRPVAAGTFQVDQPVVFVADGATRSAQAWLDDTTEAAWELLAGDGQLVLSCVPASIATQPRAIDGAVLSAPGAVLTVRSFARYPAPTP
jgi:hypothetical protein